MKKQAYAYTVTSKNSYHYLVLTILKKEGKAMTSLQLLNEIKKFKKITSKTPDATLRSVLQRSAYIENVERKYYNLKSGIKIPVL